MKKRPHYWIEHVSDWRNEPMAYWVHVEDAGACWSTSVTYQPPAPLPEGRLGFPVLCIASQGFIFRFSSKQQLAVCLQVLERKLLPTTRSLCACRAADYGPNSHWLSRLPGKIKSPKMRQHAVADLVSVAYALAANHAFRLS